MSESMSDMEIQPIKLRKPGPFGLSTFQFGFLVCTFLGLAIGLGVGLGVGLSNTETIYVTVTEASTKEPPKTDALQGSTTTLATTTLATTALATTTLATTALATTISTTTELGPPDTGETPWLNYRLRDTVVPSHYRLTLHPNMTTLDYTGTNVMTFEITSPTEYVIVHAHSSLNITKAKLEDAGGNVIAIERTFRWPEYEFFVIRAVEELENGEYDLTLEFENFLDRAIVGLYISHYVDGEDNITKGIVGSDMEPTDARRAYPCFDEPAMKIKYTTSLIHEDRHTALSNMDVNEIIDRPDGLKETIFNTSVKMSTYLGCFVVSEFDFVETMSNRGIPLRIYLTKYQKDRGQADYALKVTKIIFDKFEELFGMNYSLPKLDQIAIPNFGTGAMENWGLVTYREPNLLWDPIESSTANKQRVVQVVSHELVHQWFGNIVTMKWWDNIWLNEGFASYYEYIGQKYAEPTWQIMDHFLIDDLQPVMRVDSAITSHPIKVNVSTPAQITEVFDSITYSKGGSVLRMLNEILGDDLMYGALNRYLNNRKFANANEQDLFQDMQEYLDEKGSTVNVKEIMDPFVLQMGLPVVNVAAPSGGVATTTQEHSLSTDADLSARPASEFDYKWNIELNYFTSENSTLKKASFSITEDSISLDIPDAVEWFKLNANEMGYYRTNYDVANWDSFSRQLVDNFGVFNESDRSHVMDDGFNLALAKRLDYSRALNLTMYLDQEESYFVWDTFSSGSSYIRQMLQFNEVVYDNFKTYYRSRVKPIADKLGWNATDGTYLEKRNRYLTLALALRYEDQDALNNATQLFEDWYNGAFIHPDIRSLVYRYGIVNSGDKEVEYWEYMLDRYLAESVATEKSNLLRGLAATEDVKLLDRLLEYSKNTSIIKDQDFFSCISYISYGINGNKMAWSWAQLNWLYMVDRFGINNRNLGNLVPTIVDAYNTDLLLWEVETFFKQYPEAGAGERGRQSALEQIDANIKWMSANEYEVASWLEEQVALL